MLILRDALGGWRPGTGGGGDPLAVANAVWPDIVGAAMARSTRPVALDNETLVVRTASAAWSQEVSFHAERILAALHARAETRDIRKLRFRTGLVAAAPKAAKRGRLAVPAPRAGLAPPEAVAEELATAIARLKARQSAERDAKRRAGWKECRRCGVPVATGAFCAPCAAVSADARGLAAARIMYDAPWLGYGGTAEIVAGLTLGEYETMRLTLLARWWDRLVRARARGAVGIDPTTRSVASSFLLLKTGWEPERITPALARSELGDVLYALLYESKSDTA